MNRMPMKRIFSGIFFITVILTIFTKFPSKDTDNPVPPEPVRDITVITDMIQPRDTMEEIFEKYDLNKGELSAIFRSAEGLHNLSRLSVGDMYSFEIDGQKSIRSMRYGLGESAFLNIVRDSDDFHAERLDIGRETRIGSLSVHITDNLISSMPSTHSEYTQLSLDLADIYAWDVDFFSDIRNGDTIQLIVEEKWSGEVFRGYGNILAAVFENNGTVYRAYRFQHQDTVEYYDGNGRNLRKTLLRSPLRYRSISSRFSKRRFHPILRIYRPHLGVDYAAPSGTPVSSAGEGMVVFSGYKGQNGKMVRIRHTSGYETFYGHLSRIPGKIRKGTRVSQGQIIGYVGSTGLSTGPHLDYRLKKNGRFVNPLKVQLPHGQPVPGRLMKDFRSVRDKLDSRFSQLRQPLMVLKGRDKSPRS
jgi:murein DD-endopeptidase MepM/ murein hydrolase activator NlpD